jgi:hypothetical protein
MDWPGLA